MELSPDGSAIGHFNQVRLALNATAKDVRMWRVRYDSGVRSMPSWSLVANTTRTYVCVCVYSIIYIYIYIIYVFFLVSYGDY